MTKCHVMVPLSDKGTNQQRNKLNQIQADSDNVKDNINNEDQRQASKTKRRTITKAK